MRTRPLGRTGLQVSELCLGTMTFGGAQPMWPWVGVPNQEQGSALVGEALDAGINLFDTADAYGDGESEVILGKAHDTSVSRVALAPEYPAWVPGEPSHKSPDA